MTPKVQRKDQVALIVEGGGFKSAFTAGILDTFIVNNYYPFHFHLGISGGAMNLTSYISQQYKRNINIILAMSENNHFISIIRFLKGGNYMELKYMLDVAAKQYPFDMKSAIKKLTEGDCKVVVTNYESGRPAYLSVKKYGWIKTIEATGSLPIATRGYCEIAGKKYIDGGLADPLPVKRVYDWGYRKIILLRTNSQDVTPDWNIESLYGAYFYKNNPKLKNLISRNDKIYSKSLKYISKPPKDLDLIQVFPSQELECGVLINSIEHIRNDYHYGLEIGLDTISKLSSS